MSRLRLGWLALAAGLLLLALVARGHVGQPPLYDGVVVEDPYRYLAPSPGQPGDPSSASASLPLDAGVSPAIVAATTENPPQAQLIVDRDAMALPSGTTSLEVRIVPVPAPVPIPASIGLQAGNAYRMTVTNQAGVVVNLRSGRTATVVLRAPGGVTDGVLAQLVGSAWAREPTDNAGLPDMYELNAPQLGIFAVVRTGSAASSPGSPGASAAVSLAPSPQPSGQGGIGAPIWIAIGLLAAAVILGIWYLRDVARQGPG